MPPQERIPERICGQIGDVQLPQIVTWLRKVGSLVQDVANRAEVDDVNKRVEDVLEQIKIVISQIAGAGCGVEHEPAYRRLAT